MTGRGVRDGGSRAEGNQVGGGVDPCTLSVEAKSELHATLSEILAGVMGQVKEGDLGAALVATGIATQRARYR